jgi:membrane protein required for colicin V production
MPSDLITQLNWVDIVLLAALIRIIYIGVKQGLLVELSKILGVILGAVVAFHYYIGLSDFIVSNSPLPTGFSDLICLTTLFLIVVLVFKFIREGLAAVVKADPIPFIKSWGGFVLGALRGWIFCSFFIYIMLICGFGYIEKSARQSYSANYMVNVAPEIYSFSFDQIIGKFFPSEHLNSTVFAVVSNKQGPERKSK